MILSPSLSLSLSFPPSSFTPSPSLSLQSNLLSSTPSTNSSSTLNSDPPFNVSDFIKLYNASVQAFNQQAGQYNSQLQALQQVYTLGDQVVNLVSFQILHNITVSNSKPTTLVLFILLFCLFNLYMTFNEFYVCFSC